MNVCEHLDVALNLKTAAATFSLNGWFVSGNVSQQKLNILRCFLIT
jgi:hypothetical protein